MTFEGVILNIDGQPDSSGDVFAEGCVLEIADKPVPIFRDFDHAEIVGEARLIRDGSQVKYKIDIWEAAMPEQLARMLTPCIGGSILEKEENLIKKAKLTMVGLATINADSRIKKLGEE